MKQTGQSERIKTIQSPQNPIIKRGVRLLQKKKERIKENSFLVEGFREVQRAFKCGYQPKTLFYRPDLVGQGHLQSTLPSLFQPTSSSTTSILPSFSQIQCSSAAFQKLAYRSDIPNVIAEFELKAHSLEILSSLFTPLLNSKSTQDSAQSNPQLRSHPPLILGLDQIEKPGNLGAILRTASGLGIDGVLLCDSQVDLYHPNVIRNSLGGVFHLPIAQCTLEQAITWYRKQHQQHMLQCWTTYLEGVRSPHLIDFKQASLIMLGSEAFGVRSPWVEIASQCVMIPMDTEVIDSFNVSVASALMMYEALRQRRI